MAYCVVCLDVVVKHPRVICTRCQRDFEETSGNTMTTMYRRDASWHPCSKPGKHIPRYHAARQDDPALAACSRWIALNETTEEEASDIPEHRVCAKVPCKAIWRAAQPLCDGTYTDFQGARRSCLRGGEGCGKAGCGAAHAPSGGLVMASTRSPDWTLLGRVTSAVLHSYFA